MSEPINDIKKKLDRMELKAPRPRLIDIIVADRRDGTYDLIYAFHHEGKIVDVRYVFKEEDELESLSDRYSGALFMEREAMEMFGVKFKGVDGAFLLDPELSPKTPLRLPRLEVKKDG